MEDLKEDVGSYGDVARVQKLTWIMETGCNVLEVQLEVCKDMGIWKCRRGIWDYGNMAEEKGGRRNRMW